VILGVVNETVLGNSMVFERDDIYEKEKEAEKC